LVPTCSTREVSLMCSDTNNHEMILAVYILG
jgi:hypothetical protein